ncbi:OmpA family protein [Tenacibaculum finnmarkense]|uniref:OmpA family protein n=1 Tax=Tenacibaculum finnmarkense TaxID=2781243 RepID=UPI00187B1B84|nr:OmpA family protein [Tenacibaculum finnmarkense]MBE7632816.1 OmpA family protein [Tenacibaculum finnmarkense genomovar ulcerans]MCD8428685.1 OmpA family protein [Tenacibaculum finnmarkense genomovar ulcerans]MCG8784245.1 OmpA family protein [Tenacibaculum finnmarkense]MCG8812063.1 OmpA family protein [Tenacibaculum finnmarkense]
MDTLEEKNNQFDLSTGDLMASILMVFVLCLIGTMLQLEEEFDDKSKVAERYKELQSQIYIDLQKEFKDDLKIWGAEIDKEQLIFRFTEPDILFKVGRSEVKKQFRGILKSFFPRYIKVLNSVNYKDHIEEIRVEGHTSSEGKYGMTDEQAYFYNMKLSQDRTRSVLSFVLNQLDKKVYQWTKLRTTANGLSSVKPIAKNDTEANRKQNRRVEFRIKTDAEKQIREMLLYGND